MQIEDANQKSFYEFVSQDDYVIEIPIIQRDYAQGRTDPITNEIRNDFLTELKDYVDSGERYNDLDFVYGRLNKEPDAKVLILLDGQQRMTTLFLLHWYAAIIADGSVYNDFRKIMLKGNHSRFTYKTRFSSSDFCDALIKLKREYINNKQEKEEEYLENNYYNSIKNNIELSDLIKTENWFNAHWNEDPTIKAMLYMLDAIQKKFPYSEYKNLYNILTGSDGKGGPAVSFQFLDLKNYKLTDELYIKMNSRGKSLTRFENLKAKLLNEYERIGRTKVGKDFNNSLRFNQLDLKETMAYRFDINWTDVLWNFWLEDKHNSSTPLVDSMFCKFISVICIAEHTLFLLNINDSEREDPNNQDFERIANLVKTLRDSRTEIEYKTLIDIFTENEDMLLYKFVKIFEALIEIRKVDNYFKTELIDYFGVDYPYKSFNNYFKTVLFKNIVYNSSYRDEIIFYAYYQYLLSFDVNKKDGNSILLFKNWMHFIINVINNSRIDGPDEYVKALLAVNLLLKKDINEYLSNNQLSVITKNLQIVSKNQIEEERIKIILSRNSSEWKKAIEDLELNIPYLMGELNFPLEYYSGVSTKTLQKDIYDKSKLSRFNYVSIRMQLLFDTESGCSHYGSLCRALLSKGDYLKASGGYWTFLINTGKKERDISWKSFLGFQEDEEENNKRSFFSELIDSIEDLYCSKEKIKKGLEKICSASKNDNSIERWRHAFIDNPEIFEDPKNIDSRYNYIQWIDEDWIYVLASSHIGKYHSELFSLAAYYSFLRNGYQYAPFTELLYDYEQGRDAEVGFYFSNSKFDNENNAYYLYCLYEGNKNYSISFCNKWDNEKEIHKVINNKKITQILEKLGFVCAENFYVLKVKEAKLFPTLEEIFITLDALK